jgi:hypothetical protein
MSKMLFHFDKFQGIEFRQGKELSPHVPINPHYFYLVIKHKILVICFHLRPQMKIINTIQRFIVQRSANGIDVSKFPMALKPKPPELCNIFRTKVS